MKRIILLTLLLTGFCKAQDTLQYSCSVVTGKKTALLYESMQLYPGNFVKWTGEYDLSWSEYGKYTIKGDTLQLDLYNSARMDPNSTSQSFRVADSLATLNEKPFEVKYYKISGDNLYFLKLKGKKFKQVKRIYDDSLPKPLGWLFGNGRKYFYRKETELPH